eukprot:1258050-Amorphochlora_amoeboformis.AAC.2
MGDNGLRRPDVIGWTRFDADDTKGLRGAGLAGEEGCTRLGAFVPWRRLDARPDAFLFLRTDSGCLKAISPNELLSCVAWRDR